MFEKCQFFSSLTKKKLNKEIMYEHPWKIGTYVNIYIYMSCGWKLLWWKLKVGNYIYTYMGTGKCVYAYNCSSMRLQLHMIAALWLHATLSPWHGHSTTWYLSLMVYIYNKKKNTYKFEKMKTSHGEFKWVP